MKFFSRKSSTATPLSSDELVGEFGAILESYPSGVDAAGDFVDLPWDIELIKAALIDVAYTDDSRHDACAQGFLLLDQWTPRGRALRQVDLAELAKRYESELAVDTEQAWKLVEISAHKKLSERHDHLTQEFATRLVCRKKFDA